MIRWNDKMDEYDLPRLYRLLLNFKESKERKKMNTRRIAKDPETALVATSKKNKQLYSRADYKLPKADLESNESDEDEETAALKSELTLLT